MCVPVVCVRRRQELQLLVQLLRSPGGVSRVSMTGPQTRCGHSRACGSFTCWRASRPAVMRASFAALHGGAHRQREHSSHRRTQGQQGGRSDEHLPARGACHFSGGQLCSPVLSLSLLRDGTALNAVADGVQLTTGCAQLGEQRSAAVLHLTLKCVRLQRRASA